MSYWSKLSMKDRANVMKLFLDKGISDLDTIRREYNIFAEGGSIHIDPSKKGTFTAAASKHGMGVQEFASKVLANKEDYSPAMVKKANFARNASKWHGLGGNLYDGTSQPSQQMDNSYTYYKPLDNIFVDSEGNLLDPSVPSAKGTIRTPDVVVTANPIDVGRGKAARLYNDYGIASNDATSTPLTRNIHLNERGLDGATKAAAWMRDHPTLNNVGMALGATPFAVAGYPAFMAAGEGTATALANPYVDAALTSGFGAHGLQKLANGEADWSTALEITPLGRLARPMWNAGKEAVYNIADRYMFMPHQNSFTRGIGGEAGLQDLVESGLVRGNPIGTEVTAKAYGKLTRSNRNNFNDIMRDTGIDNIAHRYYNRTLTEEDFNAIKKAAQKYKENTPSSGAEGRITLLRQDKDPLSKYSSYQDYQAQLTSDRQTLANATSLDDSGQPLAYFYDNGRNPLTAGHDYAASDYGVRINNASGYNPRIFDGHLHYSMPEAVPLRDPNVEVFEKGPFGLTVKLDKETMNPLWKQDLKALFSKGTNRTPQITAENAASMTPIPNNSSIRYAGSAKEDYTSSGHNLLDYLRDDKINAFLEGKPFYEMDLGPLGTRRESFPSDWTMTKMPFSNESKEIINNSAKPRILAQAEKDIRDVYDPAIDGPDIEKYVKDELSYIEKQLDAKINEGYELGSDALFKAHDKGKTATRTGGLQLTSDGKIILREGEDPERFAVHEWEHRRTNSNIGGAHYGNEKKLLKKAFTKEFRELSETVPDFKGMNMDDEMVTTVSDTREALIGKTHLRKTAPDLQNKMIDKSSDERVFEAVEKANAYGSFYIKKMRELGKLTPELAQNIREALKHVGAYAIPTAVAAGALYRKQE